MSALSNQARRTVDGIISDLSDLTEALTRFRDSQASEDDLATMRRFHWDTHHTFTHSGSTADLLCMHCGGWSLSLDDDEIACPACMEKVQQEESE